MTTITLERVHFTANRRKGAAASALGDFAARGWRRFVNECRIRRAMRHLEALDDRMLRDIGISRSEIPAAVRGAVGERRSRTFL